MQPIDPDTELSVRLQAQEWNQLMHILADSVVEPYRIVAPLIQKIGQQIHTAAERGQEDYPRMADTGSKAHERDAAA